VRIAAGFAPLTDNFAHSRAAMGGEATKAFPTHGHGRRRNLTAKSFLYMAEGQWEGEKLLTERLQNST
jgi:hypothetical protein